MITISGTLSKAWMAKSLNVMFDHDYYFDPDKRYSIDSQCNEYAAKQFPGMRLFYSESNLGQIDYWNNRQIQVGGIQPNMILGMLLGADFIPWDAGDADITPTCLIGKNLVDLPEPESLLNHQLITLFDQQIRQLHENSERHLHPIPPFFWDISGRAAIHGAMTTAQKLFGESIFIDMMTKPDQCLRLMQWIGNAFVVLCRHFSEIADLPITEVHIGECSSCMVSPQMIDHLVVPAMSEIGEKLGPIRLHSCGPSTKHLEAFFKITNLHSFDLGGETSICRIREVFGNQMWISVSPLPTDMSAEETEPILRWAKRVLDENNDGNLEYVYHLEPSYNVDTIYALTDFVKALSEKRNK